MKNVLMFIISFTFVASFALSKEKVVEKKENKNEITEATLSGLKLRSIGPAIASGRIVDIAVNPNNFDEFYLAVACGGVWKTTNHGTSFQPIFETEASFSTGCVTIDPNNPFVVWVGTGENNSQRSVSYGDGVYKSTDAGKSWKNMGLKKSEHIGKIVIDPRNSNVVFVAAQGPLWNPGGDRGLYKSTDGGETWSESLKISENTGVSDLVFDNRNPDVMYCSSYQRRRHVWTLIDGGPESAVYKSTDAGKTWNKLAGGLPGGEVGRIGLGNSPVNPDILYAIIELPDGGGFYKSTDRGASWAKTSSGLGASAAQYYQELFCDPKNADVVYSINTYTSVTRDGGKTFSTLSIKEKHVDDHVIWINPKNTLNLIMGCDGGLYESNDGGNSWRYFENLSITQFYRVSVDNSVPFYNVYGGTQDNNSLGGPSRTKSANGIMNQDWIYTVGGDGYETVIDPKDPNVVYAQSQYGGLVRYDKKTGEMNYIQPQPEKGEELRWNWDTPILISPHKNTRLYFAANKLFMSEDRGQSWKKISQDLTRQIERDKLPVMGRVWEPEAVAKNASTSIYGNAISLDESPKKEGLIYVGTDDGLIQMTENFGETWTKYANFPGVPEFTYNSDVLASLHNENVVYATFDNHKNGDYKPYVLKSNDKGKTWVSISSNLPENGAAYTIAEDHVNPNLLFLGTEYGLYTSIDGGAKWLRLKTGLPTIPIKDIDVQRRENDLALATFGRGFYILDDYTPLRSLTEEITAKEAHIFPIKDALLFREDESFGRRSMGENFFRSENLPMGAVFTYYIKDTYQTRKDIRKKSEKDAKEKYANSPYPTFEELRAEDTEPAPYLIFEITDAQKNVVRRLTSNMSKGINRISWDCRYPDTSPISKGTNTNKNSGVPIVPGDYFVSILKVVDGVTTQMVEPTKFTCKSINNSTLPAKDPSNLLAFQQSTMEFNRKFQATNNYLNDLKARSELVQKAYLNSSANNISILNKTYEINKLIENVNIKFNGNSTIGRLSANQTPSLRDRLDHALYSFWESYSDPTETARNTMKVANEIYDGTIAEIESINNQINDLVKELDKAKAPAIPGLTPNMK